MGKKSFKSLNVKAVKLTGILRGKLKNVILMIQKYSAKGHWYILDGRQII